MRLIGLDGEQLGIVKIADAFRLSEQSDVDLVEIAPNAEPPVCRLMDYGKFKYQEQKRQAEARSKQKVIQVKEVKFRPATDEGDYQVKLRNLRRFLEEGDKAKVTLRFRGREMAHQELGMRVLERVRDDLVELAQVEAMPKLEGRQMVMVLAPKKKAAPAQGRIGRLSPTEPPSGRLWRSAAFLVDATGVHAGRPGQPRMQVTNPPRPPGRPAGSLLGGSALRCGNQPPSREEGGVRSGVAMHVLFVLDPLPLLKAYKDSSVAMMRALVARGIRSAWPCRATCISRKAPSRHAHRAGRRGGPARP